MSAFARAFFLTLTFILLVFVLFSAFGLVNLSVAESGFSSGKVLFFSIEEEILHTEIFGRRFFFDLGFFGEKLLPLKYLFLLFPPFLQLFFRGIFFFFEELL